MQSRIAVFITQSDMKREYALASDWEFQFRYNITPDQDIPVVLMRSARIVVETMPWFGLCPETESDPAGHCIVPVSWYLSRDSEREKMKSQLLIAERGRPVSLAGLVRRPGVCSIIWGDDMPIALDSNDARAWLSAELSPEERRQMLRRGMPLGVKVIDGGAGLPPIPSEELCMNDVPPDGADQEVAFRFALTFPGYDWWNDGRGDARALAAQGMREDTGNWPDDLDLLRNALFHMQRALRMSDFAKGWDAEYFDLLAAIRKAVASGKGRTVAARDKNLKHAKRFRRQIMKSLAVRESARRAVRQPE